MRTGPKHCLSLGMNAGHKGYDKSSPSVCPSNENAAYSITSSCPRLTFMVSLQETRMLEYFMPRIEFFAFHHLLLQGLLHRSCVDCGGQDALVQRQARLSQDDSTLSAAHHT